MKHLKSIYPTLIATFILVPNIYTIILGIESFPYTCAPMFGHYINDETDLYLLKFEGETVSNKIDLKDYYGRPEDHFIRHFFSKVYGSTQNISPFSNRLTENEIFFNQRMNSFFRNFSNYLNEKQNLELLKINLMVKKVNSKRQNLSEFEIIGFYSIEKGKYYSLYENNRANL
ncbi:hypothetical protein N1F78_14620 [Seonamhaeicola sp. MEBiC1930]|uniref:hypothetical protein n=1 Tax=Seonamhaeicola sp. MEBiC01930 TaxID=2976768 RepID=UPI00324B22EE